MSSFNPNENEQPHAPFTLGEEHDDSARRRAEEMIFQNFTAGAYQPASTHQTAPFPQTAPTVTPPAYDPPACDPPAYDPLAHDPLAYDPLAYDPLAYNPLATPFDNRPGTFGIPAQPHAFDPNAYGVAQDQFVNSNPLQVYDPQNVYQPTLHHPQTANCDTSGGFTGLNNFPFNTQSGDVYPQGGDFYTQGGNAYTQGGDFYTQGGDTYLQSGDFHVQDPANLVGQEFIPNNGIYSQAPIHDFSQSFTQENGAFPQFPANEFDEAFTQSIEHPSHTQSVDPSLSSGNYTQAPANVLGQYPTTSDGPWYPQSPADGIGHGFVPNNLLPSQPQPVCGDFQSPANGIGHAFMPDNILSSQWQPIYSDFQSPADGIGHALMPDNLLPSEPQPVCRDFATTDVAAVPDVESSGIVDADVQEALVQDYTTNSPSFRSSGAFAGPDGTLSRDVNASFDTSVIEVQRPEEMYQDLMDAITNDDDLLGNYQLLDSHLGLDATQILDVDAEAANDVDDLPPPDMAIDSAEAAANDDDAKTDKTESFDWGSETENDGYNIEYDLDFADLPPPLGPGDDDGDYGMLDAQEHQQQASPSRPWTRREDAAVKHAMQWAELALEDVEPDQRWQRISQHLATNYKVLRFPWTVAERWEKVVSAEFADGGYFYQQPEDMHETLARTAATNRSGRRRQRAAATQPQQQQQQQQQQSVPGEKRKRGSTSSFPSSSSSDDAATPQLSSSQAVDSARGNHPTKRQRRTTTTAPTDATINTRLLATGQKVLDQFTSLSGLPLPTNATQILAATVAEFAPYAFAAPGELGGAAFGADAAAADQGDVGQGGAQTNVL
ncbi:hypothetical protein UCDDS831_g04234 [Diplodia seriata]|uniref:Myb-like domain-containing protein n=1 Tax=Diplodia seriata TaxID=420778 RepID=A0A0G2GCP1_9PEZI|nr:hypothetical protein UCDDS831_g04234 [Diplodia seriata]